jgi:glycosyltransferase involved in cell wall biosynthesis
MRVTFVLPIASLDDGNRVVTEYASRLSNRGHTVTVVSLGRQIPKEFGRRTKDRLRDLLTGRWRELLKDRRPPIVFPTHLDRVPHLHRRLPHGGPVRDRDVPDADVIIATWYQTVPWVAKLSPSKGRKVHFLQHDERIMVQHRGQFDKAGRISWLTPGFSRVTVASWISDIGHDEYGVDSTVVSNAVDTDLFHAEPRERNATPVVGLMYSKARFKGSDIALKSIELARREVPDLRVKLFGIGEIPQEDVPSNSESFSSPQQETIRQIYGGCDAWLFASRCEGYGLPLLEAMACRTPVVGTPAGAGRDLIDDSNGRLVPIDDAQAMAKAIIEVVTQPKEMWRTMSDAAHATAMQHTWPRATDEFEAFLNSASQ